MTRCRRIPVAVTLAVFVSLLTNPTGAEELPLTITTWNVEHLGSPGRGFGGGFGAANLPLRSPEQLKAIANLIHGTLKSDVIALQEIAINRQRLGASHNKQLDAIVKELDKLGGDWEYYLPPLPFKPEDDYRNIFCGFLWNTKRVRALSFSPMYFKNQELAGKMLFDRRPLLGYFQAIRADKKATNDFLLVNVHLASGQENDENHLIAMTLIEYEIQRKLGKYSITEKDVVILGDFNDNPHATKSNGDKVNSPALYEHMRFRGYDDLVPASVGTTRVSSKMNSLIDHVLVNEDAREHVLSEQVNVYRHDDNTGDEAKLAEWRTTFSDHFPLSIKLRIESSDDDSNFFKGR